MWKLLRYRSTNGSSDSSLRRSTTRTKLKGSLSTIGGLKAARAALALEELARAADVNSFAEAAAALEREMTALLPAIPRALDNLHHAQLSSAMEGMNLGAVPEVRL